MGDTGYFGVGFVPGIVVCVVTVCAGVGLLAVLVFESLCPIVGVQGMLIATSTGLLASVGPTTTEGPVGGRVAWRISLACFAVSGEGGLPRVGARSSPGAWRFLASFPKTCGFYSLLFLHCLISALPRSPMRPPVSVLLKYPLCPQHGLSTVQTCGIPTFCWLSHVVIGGGGFSTMFCVRGGQARVHVVLPRTALLVSSDGPQTVV